MDQPNPIRQFRNNIQDRMYQDIDNNNVRERERLVLYFLGHER